MPPLSLDIIKEKNNLHGTPDLADAYMISRYKLLTSGTGAQADAYPFTVYIPNKIPNIH